MEKPASYNRPPFKHRPWITGKLYDEMRRSTVIHCDAFVIRSQGVEYLLIDWRIGGRKRLALDGYVIEPDGLVPIWDAKRVENVRGQMIYWDKANNALMGRLHARVLQQAALMVESKRFARVMVQAHYVKALDVDCEITGSRNKYVERTAREIAAEAEGVTEAGGKLPDVL